MIVRGKTAKWLADYLDNAKLDPDKAELAKRDKELVAKFIEFLGPTNQCQHPFELLTFYHEMPPRKEITPRLLDEYIVKKIACRNCGMSWTFGESLLK